MATELRNHAEIDTIWEAFEEWESIFTEMAADKQAASEICLISPAIF